MSIAFDIDADEWGKIRLMEDGTYGKLRVTARDAEFNRPGVFVPIAGEEIGSIGKGNHINVFELDASVRPAEVPNGAYDKLFEEFIPAHQTDNSFAQFNHPKRRTFNGMDGREYGRDDFDSTEEWIATTDPVVQAIEVISAPSHSNRMHQTPRRDDRGG